MKNKTKQSKIYTYTDTTVKNKLNKATNEKVAKQSRY